MASRRQRMPGAAARSAVDQTVQRLAVALDRGLQRQIAARRQDRGAVVAEHAVDEHGVAGPRPVRAEVDARAR